MKKIFSMIALMLMAVTAHAAGTLTITISDAVMEDESYTYYGDGMDQSIAEGTYVQFDVMTWHTATGHIYINGEAVYTWSGSSYKENVYNFTAGKNCVIKGTPNFHPDNNPYIYITQDVAVTGVSLSQTEATMTVGGETLTLTPTVLPDNATDKSVTWTTSDASVATVSDDGVVTALAAGTATITATATNGTADDTSDDKTATCTVTVAEPTYTVTVKEGTEDAANWTIDPNPAEAGQAVTITYSGTKKVLSVKAVKKAAAPASGITNPVLGQVIGSDGKNYDAGSVPTGVDAVAMIAYVDGTSGLAIALADEGNMNWATAKSTCEDKAAAASYSWHLPEKAEWENMFNVNGGYQGLNGKIQSAGGYALQETVNYWSSTEDDGGNAHYVLLLGGNAMWYANNYKGYTFHVRACLAF